MRNMEKTKLQQYQDMQGMVRKEVETMFPQLYKQYATQYGVNKSPVHYHNGIDLPQIPESSVTPNIRYNTFIICDTSETFTFRAISNLRRVSFHGFAANNADGSPATRRAVITGEAFVGKCFRFAGTGSVIVLDSNLVGIPIVQGSNSMYTDSTDLTQTRVGASNLFVAYAVNSTTEVATIKIDDYTGTDLIITVTLDTNWKIQGSLMLS